MTPTQFIGVAPSALIGRKQFYRVTFDVSGQGLFWGAEDAKLNYIYEHMQDSMALTPLSPNPVTGGDTVMVVDAVTIDAGASLSVAEAVRRLQEIGGGIFQNVRSIQKLRDANAVNADDRATVTDDTNKSNDENSFGSKIGDFFSGVGHFSTLLVIGMVAYAAITLAPTFSAFGARRRSA